MQLFGHRSEVLAQHKEKPLTWSMNLGSQIKSNGVHLTYLNLLWWWLSVSVGDERVSNDDK